MRHVIDKGLEGIRKCIDDLTVMPELIEWKYAEWFNDGVKGLELASGRDLSKYKIFRPVILVPDENFEGNYIPLQNKDVINKIDIINKAKELLENSKDLYV
ncbi:MAG TPA: hypothetical protein PLK06_03945 [bacterium]|nr:hypothetical protein [bacterium]